jgi:hypothetical protein
MKRAPVMIAGGLIVGLGWWRYRDGIRHPSSPATYAKAEGLTYLKCRRNRPVY